MCLHPSKITSSKDTSELFQLLSSIYYPNLVLSASCNLFGESRPIYSSLNCYCAQQLPSFWANKSTPWFPYLSLGFLMELHSSTCGCRVTHQEGHALTELQRRLWDFLTHCWDHCNQKQDFSCYTCNFLVVNEIRHALQFKRALALHRLLAYAHQRRKVAAFTTLLLFSEAQHLEIK